MGSGLALPNEPPQLQPQIPVQRGVLDGFGEVVGVKRQAVGRSPEPDAGRGGSKAGGCAKRRDEVAVVPAEASRASGAEAESGLGGYKITEPVVPQARRRSPGVAVRRTPDGGPGGEKIQGLNKIPGPSCGCSPTPRLSHRRHPPRRPRPLTPTGAGPRQAIERPTLRMRLWARAPPRPVHAGVPMQDLTPFALYSYSHAHWDSLYLPDGTNINVSAAVDIQCHKWNNCCVE